MIILSLIGFIRFRKQKDLKSKQALLNERLRISRELHDEVGATLSGIAMYSHVAIEQVKNSNNLEAENSLSCMQKSAGEMVNPVAPDLMMANVMTSAVPVAAQIQNPSDGRWLCSHAPTAAVASGSTPTITLA